MTYAHSAYLFDPLELHSNLREQTIINDQLDLKLLRAYARSIALDPSSIAAEALAKMRFAQDWLSEMENNEWLGDKWYMIVLAGHLSEAPSLSNRIAYSYLVLLEVLPLMEWPESIARQVVYGKDLQSLVQSSESASITQTFGPLEQFGGWLPSHEATQLLLELVKLRERFFKPEGGFITQVERVLVGASVSASEAIRDAFEDAHSMLSAARDSGLAPYMLLD